MFKQKEVSQDLSEYEKGELSCFIRRILDPRPSEGSRKVRESGPIDVNRCAAVFLNRTPCVIPVSI